jgi:hypothetical protein
MSSWARIRMRVAMDCVCCCGNCSVSTSSRQARTIENHRDQSERPDERRHDVPEWLAGGFIGLFFVVSLSFVGGCDQITGLPVCAVTDDVNGILASAEPPFSPFSPLIALGQTLQLPA